jgi:hypothetical protein
LPFAGIAVDALKELGIIYIALKNNIKGNITDKHLRGILDILRLLLMRNKESNFLFFMKGGGAEGIRYAGKYS